MFFFSFTYGTQGLVARTSILPSQPGTGHGMTPGAGSRVEMTPALSSQNYWLHFVINEMQIPEYVAAA